MGNNSSTGSSGLMNFFSPVYETRKIVIVQGLQFRNEDLLQKREDLINRSVKGATRVNSLYDYLVEQFNGDFTKNGSDSGEYTNHKQKVHFELETLKGKDDLKIMLNTIGIHAIYFGHARYGRGACLDPNAPSNNFEHGDQWEQGDSDQNGLFRLGYPFVPIPYEDIRHHHYHFAPCRVEDEVPDFGKRHPYARRRLARKTLPADLQSQVDPLYESPTNRYYGYGRGKKTHILLNAGWENSRSEPFDLGATELRCKVFCVFGCSSRQHFWRIVRTGQYKGWKRPSPPIDRFAYFTTDVADLRALFYWLKYLLAYDQENNYQSWWESLEFAKRRANKELRKDRAGYLLY